MAVDIIFDYSKLQGRIREVCGSQGKMAQELGMSRTALNQKINNASDFTSREMLSISNYLHINFADIPAYFFKV